MQLLQTTFDYENMDRFGFLSHGKGPKHVAILGEMLRTARLSAYFNKPSTSAATASVSKVHKVE